MPEETVLIVGAGAIGQWLGALLRVRAGKRVRMLVRPRQLETLAAGIPFEGQRVPVELVSELKSERYDDLLFTVKAFQVGAAVEQVRAADVSSRRVWGFQNGVGTDRDLALSFPEAWYGALTTTVPVGMEEGEVRPGPKGGLAWSAFQNRGDAPPWLSQLGLSCFAVSTVDSLKWSKLLLNLTCNASCALLDLLPGPVVNHQRMFAFELGCLRETLRLLKRSKIPVSDLPAYPVTQMAALAPLPDFAIRRILGSKIKKARGQKPPSLLLDLRAGRTQSEVDVLNGAVARLAEEAGLPAPGNRWLHQTLSAVVHNRAAWDAYRGQIDAVSRQALTALAGK